MGPEAGPLAGNPGLDIQAFGSLLKSPLKDSEEEKYVDLYDKLMWPLRNLLPQVQWNSNTP